MDRKPHAKQQGSTPCGDGSCLFHARFRLAPSTHLLPPKIAVPDGSVVTNGGDNFCSQEPPGLTCSARLVAFDEWHLRRVGCFVSAIAVLPFRRGRRHPGLFLGNRFTKPHRGQQATSARQRFPGCCRKSFLESERTRRYEFCAIK
jgi:hypothetical protein